MKSEKYECIQQLLDNEICFDAKQLLFSLEAYLGHQAMVEALEYISRVEGWRYQILDNGDIELADDGDL